MNLSAFRLILIFLSIFIPSSLASVEDRDNDGLRNVIETNSAVSSSLNTRTNPYISDTDGDSMPDGLELNLGTDPTNSASKIDRPNIILINCDDLGYGDVGCFWQNQKTGNKFATPGIDAMAAEGLMLTHHYAAAPICASSRASLLQGRHQGHSDIRDKQFDKALPDNHSIASILKQGGYRTIHVGKAGLAGSGVTNLQGHPLLRGFDRFFGYYSHYHAQEHYPQNGNNSRSAAIYSDYSRITDAYIDLYSTDAWTAFAKKTLIEETTTTPNRPFFLYLAYDAPHFDNQVPPTKDYPSGKGLAGGIQWTGSPSYANTATNDPTKINNLENQHSSINALWPQYAREHASMIRRIDDAVADLLQTLRDLRIDKKTLVIFTSDNGPDYFRINPAFFQGFANFEGTKGDMWEGGLRVPTIAWWPSNIVGTNQLSNIRSNSRPSGNWDWLATFAEIASIPSPSYTDGISMAPTLTGKGIQREKGYQYFEFNNPGGSTVASFGFQNHSWDIQEQSQAIRIGDFMGVRNNLQSSSNDFRIYNVVNDPRQGINLAGSRQDLQARMKYLAISARRPNVEAPRPYDTARIPSVTPALYTSGIKYQCYEGYWSYLPEFKNLLPSSSGLTSNINPIIRSRNNDVGLSFTGYFSISTPGAYVFSINSNMKSSLWIHDSHIIDNDFNFSNSKSSNSVYLEAGLHPIRLYCLNQVESPTLDINYSGPGIPFQPMPDSIFFTDGPSPVIALQPDVITLKKNTSATIKPLENDSSNYPILLLSTGNTSASFTSFSPDTIQYNPIKGFFGSVNLPYSVTSGAKSASSNITINILFDDEVSIPLDEGNGQMARSFSTTRFENGIINGSSNPIGFWTAGKFGSALRFNGKDDQVEFPTISIPFGASPRTIMCWAKNSGSNDNGNQTLFSYGGRQNSGQRFAIRLNHELGTSNSQRLSLIVNGGSVVGTKSINDGQWHHLAVVLDDVNNDSLINTDEVSLYVDGAVDPVTQMTSRNIFTTAGLPITLGASLHAGDGNYKGDLDDLRIFQRGLTSDEIAIIGKSSLITSPVDGDDDGDGSSNLNESIAGTNPLDATSCFKINSTVLSGQSIILKWSAIAGKSYSVEESINLSEWKPVADVPSFTTQFDIPNATLNFSRGDFFARYFRLSVH
jgi:arylsulfatase A-like enzyme